MRTANAILIYHKYILILFKKCALTASAPRRGLQKEFLNIII